VHPPNGTSFQSEEEQLFYEVALDISKQVGKLLVSRCYVAILDLFGTLRYADEPLIPFSEFMKEFVKSNVNLLTAGDHSLPLGGVNLAFFKVSDRAMIVLYTDKGYSGQLLTFKSRMFEWSKKIDELIGDIKIPASSVRIQDPSVGIEPEVQDTASEPAEPEKKRGMKTVPILTRKLSGKEKFSLEVAQVLQFCDGTHSINDIQVETGYPLLKINNIIRTYQKKEWITLKRIVE